MVSSTDQAIAGTTRRVVRSGVDGGSLVATPGLSARPSE